MRRKLWKALPISGVRTASCDGETVLRIAPEALSELAFQAKDRDAVDAFHAAALAAGGRDNGAPGMRTQYHPHYYGAFILDPDGNNAEAVCHTPA